MGPRQEHHGVFANPGVGGSIDVVVFAHGKRVLRMEFDAEYFDEAWLPRLQKWLDRRHPRLRVME
ncbi:MAG TPA: hypothetical protein VGF17_10095 [Phytomonospora sp.]